jgi:hypothetical protein|tara:strand:- start:1006 stop:1107 length:102 start_codon:yes stop_codon:yes gene_type:complete
MREITLKAWLKFLKKKALTTPKVFKKQADKVKK